MWYRTRLSSPTAQIYNVYFPRGGRNNASEYPPPPATPPAAGLGAQLSSSHSPFPHSWPADVKLGLNPRRRRQLIIDCSYLAFGRVAGLLAHKRFFVYPLGSAFSEARSEESLEG